jgi:hypothetical protein
MAQKNPNQVCEEATRLQDESKAALDECIIVQYLATHVSPELDILYLDIV